ncbi:MAG TPA: metallophosphoesterase [Bdellovibrionota bacterium]|nr:metallophosphoesterase [Bdellovibrionota bacterium]
MSTRLLVVLAVVSLLIFYTLLRVSDLALKRKSWLKISVALVAALALSSQFAYRMQLLPLESPFFFALTWVGGTLLGFWGTFLLLSIPVDLVALLGSLAHRVLSPEGFKAAASRRAFLRRAIPGGLLGLSTGLAAYGLKQAWHGPVVRRVEVPVPGLPEELVGFTIAQVSDLHVGPTIDREYVEDVVTTVQSLEASMIAVTGDLADGTPEILRERMEPLGSLSAPLGVFYVTGNHEYYWGGNRWIDAARELGFTPLINANQILRVEGRKILLGGVTDPESRVSDVAAAARTSEQVDFKILLAHRPGTCDEAESNGFDLQLSGHTHAGQFFPWSMLMPLAHKYYQGLNRHGRLWVYVNAGTGYWGPPNRFSRPSEITLITLARA